MVVSILLLRLKHPFRRERIKKPFFCQSFKNAQDHPPISFLIHTGSNAFDADKGSKVGRKQQEIPSSKLPFDENVSCEIHHRYHQLVINETDFKGCTGFSDVGILFDVYGDLEDRSIVNFITYGGNEDGSQIQERVEQVECPSLPDVLKGGGFSFNANDGFREMASAASGHVRQLDMAINALHQLCTPQPSDTYFWILQACNKFKGLVQARRVHAHIISVGATLTNFLGDYLVMTLAKCGAIDDARRLYMTLPHRTVISCTALMSAYVDCGQAQEALKMHYLMQEDGMEPDSYTYVSLLKAYESMQDLKAGKHIHMYACKKGFTTVPHVCNSLLGMYGSCGALAETENLFCLQCKSNVVSWTIMLSIFIEQGQAGKALLMYRQMHEEGLNPDQFAYVFALQACSSIIFYEEQDLAMGGHSSSLIAVEVVQGLNVDAIRIGYVLDAFVGTALLTAYGKCGPLVQAEHMFAMLLVERSPVTWNAMMSAYVDKGQEEKALLLYAKMGEQGVKPEQTTFVIAFRACGNLAEKDGESLPAVGSSSKALSLRILQALHIDFCVTEQLESMAAVTALLRGYAKCGALLEAEDIFNTLLHPDLVSWNAMLTSYVEQGWGEKALCLYVRMQEEHMAVDDVTMINVLLGCSETGNTEACKHAHFGTVSTTFDRSLLVAATLIHTYGNCSMLIDAQACFDGISEPDAASWNACIADHAGEGGFTAAFGMLENLKLAGMVADELAFTSILTACMHTGLVAVGLLSFESMVTDFGLTPDAQHYSVLVDLFARAGDFRRIAAVLEKVQEQSNVKTWLVLLGACHAHSNIQLAKQVFGYTLGLQSKQAAPYVLMSNIYATAQC